MRRRDIRRSCTGHAIVAYVLVMTSIATDAIAESHPYGLLTREQAKSLAEKADNPGSKQVRDRYAEYDAATDHCPQQSLTGSPRILVTGFEDVNSDSNVSGIIADTIGLSSWWPSGLDSSLHEPPSTPAPSRVGSSHLAPEDMHARIRSRQLMIDGQPFEVCTAVLPVLWDLAAAIVVSEMDRYKPDYVLSLGQAVSPGLSVGELATNRMNGDGDNTGVAARNRILPYVGDQDPLWRVRLLLEARANEYRSRSSTTPSCLASRMQCGDHPCAGIIKVGSVGEYVCNNVAYAAKLAALGRPVCLASPLEKDREQIDCTSAVFKRTLSPPLEGTPIRFLHLSESISVSDESRGLANLKTAARVVVFMAATENGRFRLPLTCTF